MEIETYADVVCPWCLLARSRLDAALAAFDGEVNVRWRAFQLYPDAPRVGRPLLPWLGERAGGTERARQTMAHVVALAEADGLHLDLERALMANTFDAHRLLWFADQPETVLYGATADTQTQLADLLQRAHFTDGLDIAAHDVLVSLAEQVGLDGHRVHEVLAGTTGTADVRGQLAHAHDLGVTSAPTFVFDGRYAVTGVRDAATLRSVLADAARRDATIPAPNAVVPGQRSGYVPDVSSDLGT